MRYGVKYNVLPRVLPIITLTAGVTPVVQWTRLICEYVVHISDNVSVYLLGVQSTLSVPRTVRGRTGRRWCGVLLGTVAELSWVEHHGH